MLILTAIVPVLLSGKSVDTNLFLERKTKVATSLVSEPILLKKAHDCRSAKLSTRTLQKSYTKRHGKKFRKKEQIVFPPKKCRWKIRKKPGSSDYELTFTWNKSKTPDVSEYRIYHWTSDDYPFVIPSSGAKKYKFSFQYPFSFIREDDYRIVAIKKEKHSIEGIFEGPKINLRNSEHFEHYNPQNLTELFPNVPQADKNGLVLKAFPIKIDSNPNGYNPSIVQRDNGYFLVFRDHTFPKNSIYSAALNDCFQPIEKAHPMDTGRFPCEDPRLFLFHNKVHMMYMPESIMPFYGTTVELGTLDLLKEELTSNIRVQYQKRMVEKNWVFFENDSSLYFVYSFNPFEILKLNPDMDGRVTQVVSEEKTKLDWESKWGNISGGTPAILVDGEYLSFFHSFFHKDGVRIYALGAYTFEPTFPFRRKKISEYPIIWENMYRTPKTPHTSICNLLWSVVFPGGFVEQVENGRNVINLVYGENDNGICVLTLDKECLLKSLVPIDCKNF